MRDLSIARYNITYALTQKQLIPAWQDATADAIREMVAENLVEGFNDEANADVGMGLLAVLIVEVLSAIAHKRTQRSAGAPDRVVFYNAQQDAGEELLLRLRSVIFSAMRGAPKQNVG